MNTPSFFKRLAAIAYDLIALLAIWFFAALAVVIALKGEAVNSGNPYFFAYLLLITFAYFGYCWTHTGQTLGMKSWHIVVVDLQGHPIGWGQAAYRFLAALLSWLLLGLGFLSILVDKERRGWHDRLSRTQLRLLPLASSSSSD